MAEVLFATVVLAGALVLAMRRAPLGLWALAALAAAAVWQSGLLDGELHVPDPGLLGLLGWVPGVLLAALTLAPLRRALVTQPIFTAARQMLPAISETERMALEAGTAGFDVELFSGQPDWQKLRALDCTALSEDERALLAGPLEALCGQIDDWRIRRDRQIPDAVWAEVKRLGLLGMLISKEHGGLGFSAQAQSLIIGKIASRSPDVATIVMVPNSLGPGELIERYGTPQQQEHFLPRLARGDEIPCFALTGPFSGSDAANMRDVGYVCRGVHEGRETLGVRLTFDKRYITLAPVATLVGLAFRLVDEDSLLGKGHDVGITLALIPAGHPGLEMGRRHLPCGAAFPNGPVSGRDVFIPLSFIIGGEAMVGQGWRMLMECLAAGRAISLPSSAAAGTKTMLRLSSAYARVRRQFGLPIGHMEGIEEPLARLVEAAYATEAMRAATAAMVARGERPAVLSAVVKSQSTERMRRAVNDAMDIHGGRGICDGPANYLQSAYQMVPVGITVEGANILTRTLITFAQGALRAHPHLLHEVEALQHGNRTAGLAAFDLALRRHVGFTVANLAGALWHNLTLGAFAATPAGAGRAGEWYRQMSRAARSFALVADVAVMTLGARLKARQKIAGRLADALGELYVLACAVKRFEDDAAPAEDQAIVALVVQNGLHRFEEAIAGVIDNFPSLPVRLVLRVAVFPLGRSYRPAPDRLGGEVARALLVPGEVRDRLTRNIFVSHDEGDPMGVVEAAFAAAVKGEDAARKLEKGVRDGRINRQHCVDWLAEAVNNNVLSAHEAATLREIERLTARAIAVDHFDPSEVGRRLDGAVSETTAGGAGNARVAAE